MGSASAILLAVLLSFSSASIERFPILILIFMAETSLKLVIRGEPFEKGFLPRPLSKNFYILWFADFLRRKSANQRLMEFLEGGLGGTSLHKEVSPQISLL